MKRTSPPSRRPFNDTESFPDYLGPIIPEGWSPTGPAPVAFPTVQDILQHQAGTQKHPLLQLSETPPPSEPTSLFRGMLGGNVDLLVQDAAAHPEGYEPGELALINELATGARKLRELSPAELNVLDRATVGFASYRPPKPAPEKPKPPAPAKRPRLVEEANELQDGRAPQVETPGGPMTAYWWLG
jgi:hypothetical protein